MHRLILAGLLLRTCLAITLRTNAWADHERTGACRAALPGEWCHAAMTWAKQFGQDLRPEWFPGNASQYSLRDFQTLLHQLGQAECSRPCPQSSAAPPSALGLSQLGSSSAIHETYGLSDDELAGVLESSWKPKPGNITLAAQGASRAHKANCEDAEPDSMCYVAAAWLQAEGFAKHPSWYPSLSKESTMQEVQAVLFALGKAGCPKPCETQVAQTLLGSRGDGALEVDSSGRQVSSEAYEIAAPTECGDAAEGDWCYLSIMWLKNTGLQRHPDWYPRLTLKSSMWDFQTALHKEGKVGCPLPCSADSEEEGEMTTTEKARAVISPSAARANAEKEQCVIAKRGSKCYNEITRVINVGIPAEPEMYPTLTAHSSREEVQEHLYLRGLYQCGMPCPTVKIGKRQRPRRVLKNAEDMTENELTRFLNHEWDGYVYSDEYTDALPTNALEEYTNAVSADSASSENAPAKEDAPLAEAALEPKKTPASQEPSANQSLSAGDAADGCRDASVGDQCYQAVTWARKVGILERPKWYVGLSENSSVKEFQAHLHETGGPSLCPMPCLDAAPAAEGDAMKEENVTADATSPDSATKDSVMTNDTAAYAEPAPSKTDAQPEKTAQTNSTVEEPALHAQANSTVGASALHTQPEETVRANSTVEEPAPQSEVATAETETDLSGEVLPFVDLGPQAHATEEPAPQPEAATVEEEEADVLPSVDMAGHEEEGATEGANHTEEPAAQPEVVTDPQEELRRENERLRAQIEALRNPKPGAAAPQSEGLRMGEMEKLMTRISKLEAGLEAKASAEEAQVQVSAPAEEMQTAAAEAKASAEEAQVQVSAPAEEVQTAAAEEPEKEITEEEIQKKIAQMREAKKAITEEGILKKNQRSTAGGWRIR